MIDFNIKFESNKKQLLEDFDEKTEQALYAIGTQAVKGIVEYMSIPDFTGRDIVDTGRLRASISFLTPQKESGFVQSSVADSTSDDILKGRSDPLSVLVGTNVNYAAWVNNGTTKQPARHFLENGITRERDNMEEIVKAIYEVDK